MTVKTLLTKLSSNPLFEDCELIIATSRSGSKGHQVGRKHRIRGLDSSGLINGIIYIFTEPIEKRTHKDDRDFDFDKFLDAPPNEDDFK